MAKQSSILIGTRKVQELKNKPEAKKSTIDLDEIRENNAKIHKEEKQAGKEIHTDHHPKLEKKQKPKTPEKLHRVSLDLPDSLYKKVKLTSVEKGMSMRQLLMEMIRKI